ncbi:unnamed protein product, partial [Ectocarpus sp. 8 AP-2014]
DVHKRSDRPRHQRRDQQDAPRRLRGSRRCRARHGRPPRLRLLHLGPFPRRDHQVHLRPLGGRRRRLRSDEGRRRRRQRPRREDRRRLQVRDDAAHGTVRRADEVLQGDLRVGRDQGLRVTHARVRAVRERPEGHPAGEAQDQGLHPDR